MKRLVLFLSLGLAVGCDIEHLEVGVTPPAALSPGACTGVALTTPTSNFSGTVGVPIPMSASASGCAGTPEYQYWHKLSGASNWTIDLTYFPGGSSFTPPSVGTWCVLVVARNFGATENYQVGSGATCGTVGGTPPPPTPSESHTLMISALTAVPCCTSSGLGAVFQAGTWVFNSPLYTYYSVPVPNDVSIDSFTVWANKSSIQTTTGIIVDFVEVDSATGGQLQIASANNFQSNPGFVAITGSLQYSTRPFKTYMMRVSESAIGGLVSNLDTFTDAAVVYH